MVERAKRLTAVRCNGIKDCYWSMARKDELVQRLGQYEDISDDPKLLRIELATLRAIARKIDREH